MNTYLLLHLIAGCMFSLWKSVVAHFLYLAVLFLSVLGQIWWIRCLCLFTTLFISKAGLDIWLILYLLFCFWQFNLVWINMYAGLAHPPLYFYSGGVKEFLATVKQHVLLVRLASGLTPWFFFILSLSLVNNIVTILLIICCTTY